MLVEKGKRFKREGLVLDNVYRKMTIDCLEDIHRFIKICKIRKELKFKKLAQSTSNQFFDLNFVNSYGYKMFTYSNSTITGVTL
jgi:hypothetical protein